MPQLCDSRTNLGGDPKLFLQLALKRLLCGLARLDLSARKLPFQTHRLIGPTLTHQYLSGTCAV